MSQPPMYHEGMRYFQDHFGKRELAGRLEKVRHDTIFDDYQKSLIDRSAYFFLANTDAGGWPDCSYKGGLPGSVRVVDDKTLAFPSYNGNGMCRSLTTSHRCQSGRFSPTSWTPCLKTIPLGTDRNGATRMQVLPQRTRSFHVFA